MAFDRNKLKLFPKSPGVYIMKGAKGKVLYVGKAKSLHQRVKQYFTGSGDGRPMVPFLVAKVESIDTIVTGSEKEALLLENTLIKEHKPPYNVVLKDDKSFIAVKVTTEKPWPMLQVVRHRQKPKGGGEYFGPYTSAHAAREVFELLNKLFPLRQCSDREFASRKRPCILHQMGRCVAPCVKLCSKEEYDSHVQCTIQFLRGRNKEVLEGLRGQMERYSESLEYERAASTLKVIHFIERMEERQRVEGQGGIDFDVFGIFRQGGEVMLAQLLYRKGKLVGAKNHPFSGIVDDDAELMKSFLMQHYEGREVPHELLLPVAVEEEIASLLATTRKVQIIVPQRGKKRSFVAMATRNAKVAFAREKDQRTIREKTLLEMQKLLRLTNYPEKVECFDTSHISGDEPVAAMVAFSRGKKDTKSYRKYKIKEAAAGDDYGAMREAMTRRYRRAKEDGDLPDLIVVDGGKGHLNMAVKVLEELDIASVEAIGVAKETGRHDKGMTAEQVFLRGVKDPILLKKTSSILFFLQRVRDEAHRFAITFHRKRRRKARFTGELSQVAGIGPVKEKRLLKYFGSVKKMRQASLEEVEAAPGLSKGDVDALWQFLHEEQ